MFELTIYLIFAWSSLSMRWLARNVLAGAVAF